LVVVAAVAVLVAGGVAAVLLVHRNPVSAGAAASTSPTTTATAKPSKKPAFALPAVIGPYSKSADQSKAVGASRAIPVMVLAPFAAVYEETADPTRQLLVTGGFAEVDDPVGQLKNGLAEGTRERREGHRPTRREQAIARPRTRSCQPCSRRSCRRSPHGPQW
jgi:hypothetical protein